MASHRDYNEDLGPLPQSDRQDELEDLSYAAFCRALPQDKFRFRNESGKDKGVDASIELKVGSSNTNFRAQLQLKGTDKQDINSDGSISLPRVNVRNLKYLLNGQSALYILYVAPREELRYVWARDEQKRLDRENPEWEEQETITLRFADILTIEAFDLIHSRIMREAKLSSNIHGDVSNITSILSNVDFSPLRHPRVKEMFSAAQWLSVVTDDPKNTEAWMNLANSYYEQHDFPKALGAINKAWALGPINDDMRATRACIIAEYVGAHGGPKHLGHEAIALFETLRPITEVRGYTDFNIGNCYDYIDDEDKAILHFEKALSDKPDRSLATQILNNLGNRYAEKGDNRSAVRAFKKSLSYNSEHWQTLLSYASVEASQKRFKSAAQLLQKALTINPDLELNGVSQLSVLSRCLFELGQYNESLHRINQALSIDPQDVYSRNIKYHVVSKLWKVSSEYLDAAIQFYSDEIINNNHASLMRATLAELYYSQGDKEKARFYLEENINSGDTFASDLINYSRIMEELGNRSQAIKFLQEASKKSPDHYIFHHLAFLYKEEELYNEAISYYKRSLRGKCSSVNIYKDISYCYFRLNDHFNDMIYLSKAIIISPTENELWLDFIRSYIRLNKARYYHEFLSVYSAALRPKCNKVSILNDFLSLLKLEFGVEVAELASSCEVVYSQSD